MTTDRQGERDREREGERERNPPPSAQNIESDLRVMYYQDREIKERAEGGEW